MGNAIKRAGRMALLVAAVALASLRPAGLRAASAVAPDALFAQSVERRLAREFARPGISYLLMDLPRRSLLAFRWEDAERPIPLGSLVKPFTALAYGRAHEGHYPLHSCGPGQCWLPRGHGTQNLVSALANSCNAYFRALARNTTPEQIGAVAHEFQLPAPTGAGPDTLIDVGRGWPISPIAMAHAYAELVQRRAEFEDVVAGMRLAAAQGTGVEAGRRLAASGALVKTGTAGCTHSPRASADGFVVALVPAEAPRFLLLLRVHGTTGARAAATAGEMLRVVEEPPAGVD
jgi:cell division protein FtsI/penicillin-binding protein 2